MKRQKNSTQTQHKLLKQVQKNINQRAQGKNKEDIVALYWNYPQVFSSTYEFPKFSLDSYRLEVSCSPINDLLTNQA